jgi:hypothetical protein
MKEAMKAGALRVHESGGSRTHDPNGCVGRGHICTKLMYQN